MKNYGVLFSKEEEGKNILLKRASSLGYNNDYTEAPYHINIELPQF